MKYLLIILFVTISSVFMGCDNSRHTTTSKSYSYLVDTVDIHGHKHEVVIISSGTALHSPECKCFKDSTKIK